MQKICYAHEGTLNKFLIDDKGMLEPQLLSGQGHQLQNGLLTRLVGFARLFLLVFGLPPLVHPDDPSRAVLASMELVQALHGGRGTKGFAGNKLPETKTVFIYLGISVKFLIHPF